MSLSYERSANWQLAPRPPRTGRHPPARCRINVACALWPVACIHMSYGYVNVRSLETGVTALAVSVTPTRRGERSNITKPRPLKPCALCMR